MRQALTYCAPFPWPEKHAAVLVSISALSDTMLNATFIQNGRIQDKLLFLPISEFIVNSLSSTVEINYPSSIRLNVPAQWKQHVFALVAYSFPSS